MWLKDVEADEKDQKNVSKPFYRVQMLKMIDDTKASVRLHKDEECKNGKYQAGRDFQVDAKDLMEFSKRAMQGLPDMVDIDELNQATLLSNIKARYIKDKPEIYTYVGPILLAVNPFQRVDHLDGPKVLQDYRDLTTCKDYLERIKVLPPHSYAISASAFKRMIDTKVRQAIVISGESGAGKTESAKNCMKFLTSVNSGPPSIDGTEESKQEDSLEDKILKCNPVLEAFGNAKTVRNNNSSRFGKYTKLYFDLSGNILGAQTKNYLLEKSRVVKAAPNERGYHVFYHILAGGSDAFLQKLFLINPTTKNRYDWKDFNHLKTGGLIDQAIVNDVELFLELDQVLKNLKFTTEEIDFIYRITSACLHIGEIQYDPKTFSESGKPCTIFPQERLEIVANLLGIPDPQKLGEEMTFKPAGLGQKQRATYKMEECNDMRDTLAKNLFDHLFNWLVKRMNQTVIPVDFDSPGFQSDANTVGLLDIFGFENFAKNNFEQMCINYVNEKLHKLYISAIFEAEKVELTLEGLHEKIKDLKYPDKKSFRVIIMLDNLRGRKDPPDIKNGIFQIVNDSSTAGKKPTAKQLTDNIEKEHKDKDVYQKQKVSCTFMIKHSAQDVIYDTKEFIERNVDNISSSLEQLVIKGSHPVVGRIYQNLLEHETADDEKKKGNEKTIWVKFSNQMKDLMNELAEALISEDNDSSKNKSVDVDPCDLHFIRCIKPNDLKIKKTFIDMMTMQQLTYMGILESIDLKQKNFPFRRTFEEFYQQFELLSPIYGQSRYDKLKADGTDAMQFREYSKKILDQIFTSIGKESYAIGNRKILMLSEVNAVLLKAKQYAAHSKNQAAIRVKRSFSLFRGFSQIHNQKWTVIKGQKYYKNFYQKLLDERSEAFINKAKKALILYKTEKRKDYEKEAAVVLTDVYKKHIFRKNLVESMHKQQKVVQFIQQNGELNRIQKLFITMQLSNKLVDQSWKIIRNKKENQACWNLQRVFRGANDRHKYKDLVRTAKQAKENLKLHVSAKKIQKYLRGLIVIKNLRFLHSQAAKIQSYLKMRWLSQLFKNIRLNSITLQRGMRRYMARRDMIRERMTTYLSQELQVMNNVNDMEHYQLFQAASEIQQDSNGLVKEHTPYSVKKIQLFSRVIDQHILTDLSEVYSQPWGSQYIKLQTDNLQNESPLMSLSTGSTHCMAVNSKGRVFAWGWNDNGQCAKSQQISQVMIKSSCKNANISLEKHLGWDQQNTIKIKQSLACEDRCFAVLHHSDELIAWGSNDKGQLGLGHYEDVFVPTKLTYFNKNNLKVNQIKCGGNLNLVSTSNGNAYAFPFQKGGTKYSIPVKMPFSEKINISKVACGWNFGFFISNQGLVYSVGDDNQDGQLGLGHIYPIDAPQLITCFKDIGERIDSIECGYRHSIAKSTLGKVFTWGWNGQGQLGHGHTDSELSPRYLDLSKNQKKKKVIQIAAGFSNTTVMIDETREIYFFGTGGRFNHQTKPLQANLSKILPEMFPENNQFTFATGQQIDFAVVKISSSWSKTMSLINLVIADLRSVNPIHPHHKIQSALQQLSQKWDPNEVMPPYIETISGLFSASIMKKGGQLQPHSKQSKKPGKDKRYQEDIQSISGGAQRSVLGHSQYGTTPVTPLSQSIKKQQTQHVAPGARQNPY